jgi:hypothetical protein
MMPRTADGIVDYQTIGEWSVIVRARRTHCEEFFAATYQNGVFGIDLPCDHRTVQQIRNREAESEIRFCSALRVCHLKSLSSWIEESAS